MAAAEPLQHLPAKHAGDGRAHEHQPPEDLHAAEAEHAADLDHRAQRRLVLPGQADGDLRADHRDHHEGQHQRPDRADAAVQEGEQQHGGGQVGDRPEARDVERGQARVAHQPPAGKGEQHQQIGQTHGHALAGGGGHDQADGERGGPRVARQQPQEAREHEAAFIPTEAHPGAGEHQRIHQAGDDVDEACGLQRSPHRGAQRAGSARSCGGGRQGLEAQRCSGGRDRCGHCFRR